MKLWTDDGRTDGRTPDHGHPISSPCEPNGSGELKIANFHFSRFKSIETLGCHSNQISYQTEIKNTNYVETTVRNMYTKYRLHAIDNF